MLRYQYTGILSQITGFKAKKSRHPVIMIYIFKHTGILSQITGKKSRHPVIMIYIFQLFTLNSCNTIAFTYARYYISPKKYGAIRITRYLLVASELTILVTSSFESLVSGSSFTAVCLLLHITCSRKCPCENNRTCRIGIWRRRF